MARDRTIAIVLGGGRGTRLFPLTAHRAKPAVPLGGKYRLIDIPLSNAINSGLREVFVLTQFNSASLNAHIARTYRFDMFTHGFVEVLAAEQTEESGDWFQGTADAVRKHLHRFVREGVDNVVILSGDHLYRMRYDHLVAYHDATSADITVATIPVTREACEGFGVLAPDAQGIVQAFKEKPSPSEDIGEFRIPRKLKRGWGTERDYLASMGVYVFRAEVLEELLENQEHIDFGSDILPAALHTHTVAAYLFENYWADIGTIRAFYEANLELTDENPAFRFYEPDEPIYTRARFLPPTVYRNATLDRSLVTEGCLLDHTTVVHSIVGQRAWLLPGSHVEDSIIMGADFYEVHEARAKVVAAGHIPVGIGAGASLRNAIIDKNARIGEGAIIHGDPDRPDETHDSWCVREGLIIVRKNGNILPGQEL